MIHVYWTVFSLLYKYAWLFLMGCCKNLMSIILSFVICNMFVMYTQAGKLKIFGTRPNWAVSYIAFTKFHLPRPVFHSPSQIFTRIGERASTSFPACTHWMLFKTWIAYWAWSVCAFVLFLFTSWIVELNSLWLSHRELLIVISSALLLYMFLTHSLRPRRHFAKEVFKCIFLNGKVWI